MSKCKNILPYRSGEPGCDRAAAAGGAGERDAAQGGDPAQDHGGEESQARGAAPGRRSCRAPRRGTSERGPAHGRQLQHGVVLRVGVARGGRGVRGEAQGGGRGCGARLPAAGAGARDGVTAEHYSCSDPEHYARVTPTTHRAARSLSASNCS